MSHCDHPYWHVGGARRSFCNQLNRFEKRVCPHAKYNWMLMCRCIYQFQRHAVCVLLSMLSLLCKWQTALRGIQERERLLSVPAAIEGTRWWATMGRRWGLWSSCCAALKERPMSTCFVMACHFDCKNGATKSSWWWHTALFAKWTPVGSNKASTIWNVSLWAFLMHIIFTPHRLLLHIVVGVFFFLSRSTQWSATARWWTSRKALHQPGSSFSMHAQQLSKGESRTIGRWQWQWRCAGLLFLPSTIVSQLNEREHNLCRESKIYRRFCISLVWLHFNACVQLICMCAACLPVCVFLALTCADGHGWVDRPYSSAISTNNVYGLYGQVFLDDPSVRCRSAQGDYMCFGCCVHARPAQQMPLVRCQCEQWISPFDMPKSWRCHFWPKDAHFSAALWSHPLWAFCKCDVLCVSPCQFGRAHTKKQSCRCGQCLPAKLAMWRKNMKKWHLARPWKSTGAWSRPSAMWHSCAAHSPTMLNLCMYPKMVAMMAHVVSHVKYTPLNPVQSLHGCVNTSLFPWRRTRPFEHRFDQNAQHATIKSGVKMTPRWNS